MDGDHPDGHRDPTHVLQPGVAHELGDTFGPRVVANALDEIAVRLPLASQPTEERHDPLEPDAAESPDQVVRASDLEADHDAARSDDPTHLGEAPTVVGQVAHAEGDRRRIEGRVGRRQGQRVADDVLEPGAIAIGSARLVDHPRSHVHAEHPAIRPDTVTQARRDLACAGRHVDRRHPRTETRLGHRSTPPAGLLEPADQRVHHVVHAGDPVEHRADPCALRGVAVRRCGAARRCGRDGLGGRVSSLIRSPRGSLGSERRERSSGPGGPGRAPRWDLDR